MVVAPEDIRLALAVVEREGEMHLPVVFPVRAEAVAADEFLPHRGNAEDRGRVALEHLVLAPISMIEDTCLELSAVNMVLAVGSHCAITFQVGPLKSRPGSWVYCRLVRPTRPAT